NLLFIVPYSSTTRQFWPPSHHHQASIRMTPNPIDSLTGASSIVLNRYPPSESFTRHPQQPRTCPHHPSRGRSLQDTNPLVNLFYCWLFRLVPIAVVFLAVNCLVAFLFNQRAAITIIN